ncbi:hypothetical protein GCM10010196_11940 [Agromyces mediolanus]|uniref:Uncharacterized protein n=1 Tax=Agromyces mediolanus TaxID=41986 RepID=A0A918CES3_AGRME|nr:hypothetical protein GCM10010196_11940 [Agromyces mediolanus]GLJ73197.1 hypothetical protein GCM10017583_24550 [Agromyces mediolanus]
MKAIPSQTSGIWIASPSASATIAHTSARCSFGALAERFAVLVDTMGSFPDGRRAAAASRRLLVACRSAGESASIRTPDASCRAMARDRVRAVNPLAAPRPRA